MRARTCLGVVATGGLLLFVVATVLAVQDPGREGPATVPRFVHIKWDRETRELWDDPNTGMKGWEFYKIVIDDKEAGMVVVGDGKIQTMLLINPMQKTSLELERTDRGFPGRSTLTFHKTLMPIVATRELVDEDMDGVVDKRFNWNNFTCQERDELTWSREVPIRNCVEKDTAREDKRH